MRDYFLIAALALVAVSASPAQTSTGGSYAITRHTVDSGGGESSGGEYRLAGTAGQAESGQVSTGGSFALRSGFWASGEITPPTGAIFRNGFESSSN
ncbi:MAG: hypothetical protein AAGA23_02790 [Pseudomonadota bacterium]